MSYWLREYYPPPSVDWSSVESVKAWIEHVRWHAFFNGARGDDISRVEAEKLVEELASGMEARQGGNAVPPRSGDSPTRKGDAQPLGSGNSNEE